MTQKQFLLLGLLLLLTTASLTGCLAVAAAAAAGTGVAYAKGNLEATLPAPPDQVALASQQALRDLGLAVADVTSDATQARVLSQSVDNKEIKINVTAAGPAVSDVSIRVGVFGDEALSRRILSRIESNLGPVETGG